MNWVSITGWSSVFLFLMLISLFVLRRVNSKLLHNNPKVNKAGRVLSKIHPVVGILLVICGGIHGYMALFGTLMLHTGTILYGFILLNFILFIVGKVFKLKYWIKMHRVVALLTFLSLMMHLFFRDIIPY